MHKCSSHFSLLLLLVTVVSCKRETAFQKAGDHFLELQSAYCTNDIRGAESTLLNDLQMLSQYESNHVQSIDFDMARAMDHERLFLIYRKTHETNKMEFEFQKSIELLNQEGQKWKSPEP